MSIVLEEEGGACLFDMTRCRGCSVFGFFDSQFFLVGFDPCILGGDDLFGYCEFTCLLSFSHDYWSVIVASMLSFLFGCVCVVLIWNTSSARSGTTHRQEDSPPSFAS